MRLVMNIIILKFDLEWTVCKLKILLNKNYQREAWEKHSASAFYYPGPLFDLENCEQATRITKRWKKNKNKNKNKHKKNKLPALENCSTFNSPPYLPFEKKTFLSLRFNNSLRSAERIVSKSSNVSN